MSKGTGGAAFPELNESYVNRDDNTRYNVNPGMRLRDYFAAKAMQALVETRERFGAEFGYEPLEQVAGRAYQMADAMLAERAK